MNRIALSLGFTFCFACFAVPLFGQMSNSMGVTFTKDVAPILQDRKSVV